MVLNDCRNVPHECFVLAVKINHDLKRKPLTKVLNFYVKFFHHENIRHIFQDFRIFFFFEINCGETKHT